jgi:glycosyltransferase involved in cell wall biosynthesis
MGACANFHPFIVTGWGSDIFDSPKNPLLKYMLKYTFKKADKITVLTKVTQTEISKLTNKKVSLIPFGVDMNKFIKDENKQNEIIRIGSIRSLTEKYGIEFLIRAFAILKKKYNNIRLEIVGDGPLRNKFEKLTEELEISDAVTFHGYINQYKEFDKYISLLKSFDIFAILSIIDSETFGVAAVEASACSIPVIATNVGGLPEVVEDNITGLIVPPKNVEATAEAIEKLIINKELRIRLGQKGREKVNELYNWNNNLNQMIEIYKSFDRT